MKFPLIYAVLTGAGLMATPAHLSAQTALSAATNMMGPKITFATNEYNFGKVISGEVIKYVFIVSNAGDQTLVISNVAPGCHCTSVGKWTRQIEPGKTGEIPAQFDTHNVRGDSTKYIKVTSNDKLAPVQSLTMRGSIRKAIKVSPEVAFINVMPDAPTNSTLVVHIASQLDEPLVLSNAVSTTNTFKAELKTIKPGKEFEMVVTVVPPLAPGNNPGTVSVATSFTNMPEFHIQIFAVLQPVVGVSPPQITLPAQIDAWTTNLITLTANESKALALSGLEVSDQRIVVELKETTPGRIFELAAAVPPGFQLAPGQQAQVSVKSNNAEEPLIVVPIVQFPHRP